MRSSENSISAPAATFVQASTARNSPKFSIDIPILFDAFVYQGCDSQKNIWRQLRWKPWKRNLFRCTPGIPWVRRRIEEYIIHIHTERRILRLWISRTVNLCSF